ncbi:MULTISPECIES: penicillin-binding protein 2 [unclassified Yoonia]|uniref:penicillin-binding protein 2 n=1 Tax=unclassified Yoonia TaxID=2629118 RepID=UPI002AFF99C1|nr:MULTISPECIES: penicillin-binding protein 2 [unclassified Yoonia]
MKRSPKDVINSSRIIGRRALVVGGLQLGIMGAIGFRLRDMQVEQADQYRMLAEENRISMRLLPPARGMIFDRNGIAIAANEQNYRVVMVREDAGDIEQVLARLTEIIDIPPDALTRAIEEMRRRAPFVPVTILERVSWDDVAQINLNTPVLPGVQAEVGLSRYYPMGEDMAHVVGYVGPVSDYDLSQIENPDPLLQIPKFEYGKTGAENRLEEDLRGKAGTRRIEISAAGRIMRELDRQEGIPGKDVQLTIDARLQSYVQARLDGESASAVVIDLENGDLRAVVSSPSFDPNMFVRGISVADWQSLMENKYRPMAAKAVQGTYPPGSTFKMVTLLAAMEAGVIGPEDTVFCPGHADISGIRFHCWKRGGHGNMNLHESMKQSCDVYYYDVAQRVGIDKMAEMARKLGLGVRHDLPLSAVATGIAPDREWKSTVRGENWRIGDTVNASIGQGYVLTSPMQLAVMTARLATGHEIKPRLIRLIDGVEQPGGIGPSLGLNENTLRRVRASMDAVCNHNRGTAYGSRIVAEDRKMAGKTGTSQVRRITLEERAAGVIRNEDLPWERRDHALFVGYAPLDNPRYAVSVVVEHGGGGSSAAAPVARDILLQAQYGGPPPLEAYPSNLRDQIAEQQRRIADRIPAGTRSQGRA